MSKLIATLPGQRALAFAGALVLSLSAVTVTASPARAATADLEDRFHFVLFTGGDSSSMMNGSSSDYERARALRAGGTPMLYVRQDGAAYVIRDAALLRRASQLVEPQRVLGARQGALGRQQGELGRQQGALGRQQAQLGLRQAGASDAERWDLGRQQAELGRTQAALGARQAALGRQQGDLGREQARLAGIAQANLRDLLREAQQRGLAQRID